MSWRTVVVSSRCKLDYKMGYMVIRGEETKRIFLDEVAILLIENPAIALTGCLLEKLTEQKVRVIFCDSARSPMAELVPLHGSYDSSRKLRMQLAWSAEGKDAVWREIVAEKIRQQASHLADQRHQKAAVLLESYIPQIQLNDSTNREGHAAKVYFNALLGMEFSRQEKCPVNAALNYGYSIILSAFNREISACGYLTEIGIHHNNVFNQFNLSSDLMEPFRVLVDRKVIELEVTELTPQIKRQLTAVLNEYFQIENTQQTVLNGIRLYVRSIFAALNENDPSRISFYQL